MTQNMNSGTDLNLVLAWGAPLGVALTHREIVASDIPGRADLLAAQIAVELPDIVALQEVTLWRSGPTPETATGVLFDPLASLLAGFAARGTPYAVAAVNVLTDLSLPGRTGEFLRYTDRDVMLIRADLGPPAFNLADVRTYVFGAALEYQGRPVLQGWISAEVRRGNRHFRLVMTHLESAIEGMPEATSVQIAQTTELLQFLGKVTVPVVLCGDFNSDAEAGGYLDSTASVGLTQAAGYADCWKLVPQPGPGYDSGYTWPLFREDQLPLPSFVRCAPFERLDLFFAKGVEASSMNVVVAPAPAGMAPPYGSDHAGVVATFQL